MTKYIFHLGISDYPNASASAHRIRLTFKGLKLLGFYTLVINKNINVTTEYKVVNRADGIPFLFTSLKISMPKSFIGRYINKLTGIIGEVFLLYKKRKKLHTAIFYSPSFSELVYYRLLSKILRFKIIIQYVEMRSKLPERNTIANRLNDWLFDSYFNQFCDGAIVISDYLVQHVSSKNKQFPMIKLPVICDYDEFNSIMAYENSPYLMFCGNILYSDIIEFILDIYSSLKSKDKYHGLLLLVISGNKEDHWRKIKSKISSMEFRDQIIIKSQIPYHELQSLYKGADLLMIPLRNTLQDIARFPHKIGEYCASAKPIVSTNIGEPKVYFEDGKSAILVDDYSHDSYLEKLSEILSSKKYLNEIGKEGYKIGLKYFDYRAQTVALKKFILNL